MPPTQRTHRHTLRTAMAMWRAARSIRRTADRLLARSEQLLIWAERTASSQRGPPETSLGSHPITDRHTAGARLVAAYEKILGVEGPTALAGITDRSKGWWSKLRTGKHGMIPSWPRVALLLPADLSLEVLEALKEQHRAAWLEYYDPEFAALVRLRALP